MITDWKNKKVAVLGFGVEGKASVVYLASKGAVVTVLDRNNIEEVKGVTVIAGKQYLDNLAEFDVIVRSPGIRRNLSQLLDAEKKGTTITSQTQIFLDECPCPVIGVTGTKGKGTTSSLIYEMLKKAGKDAYLGGNIGKPPFEFLDTLKPQSFVVLELSSFQLQDVTKSPHIAIMLMVTSEHLEAWEDNNYHEDVYDYIASKRNILKFQTTEDVAILNRDYPASNESDIHTEGKVYQVSREREVDEGCYVQDGAVMLRENGKAEKIIDVTEISLPGGHNLENVCAAVMAAKLVGVDKKEIQVVLRSFKGLEHRLELVAEINGVKYYDDSFSTTPETAIAAIEAFDAPEILILGGSPKKSDFSELGKVIYDTKNIKAIIGIGIEWEQIKKAILYMPERIQIIEGAKDMHRIVFEASELAEPGDVVLLSPACASFDMFKNYKDRGEQFKKEVLDLRNSAIS